MSSKWNRRFKSECEFESLVLSVEVSIYCYLIKYWAKHLLPFHYTNNELKWSFIFITAL